MNGITGNISDVEFQALTTDQKLNVLYGAVREMQDKYALKWVETSAKGIVTLISLCFFAGLAWLLGWHQPPQT